MEGSGRDDPTPDPVTSEERFRDPVAAAEYLETLRWPHGATCPHCGEHARSPYQLKTRSSTRRLWKCRACRRQFTVTVGTVFESSHLPLDRWLLGFRLVCSGSAARGAPSLATALGVTEKTARSVLRRVRQAQAMAAGGGRSENAEAREAAALRVALALPPRPASDTTPASSKPSGTGSAGPLPAARLSNEAPGLGVRNTVAFGATLG